MPDSMTPLLLSGPTGTRKNIAVLGDGFAEDDQDTYNAKVRELLIDGVFGHDYFNEDRQAFNIFRVNLISKDSGVSRRVYDEHGTPDDASDDTITSTTLKDTALGYIYSGSWAHCWLEGGTDTWSRTTQALNTWVPDYDLVVIILNDPGFGGCGGGGFQIVTMGSDWPVMAHEFGHGTGGLADEYCRSGIYSGGEPGDVNVTANTNLATLKWRQFVDPATPIPTGVGECAGYTSGPKPSDWSDSQDVGLFEGAQYCKLNIYRPVINCRMRGNVPEYCPVCYTELKKRHDALMGRTFLRCYTGDYDGDGKDDLLVHNDTGIMIFRSSGTGMDLMFSAVGEIEGGWKIRQNDRFYAGDFNGDGKDEVVVVNASDWGSTGWLGLLAADGAGGLSVVRLYSESIGKWHIDPNDEFLVADFNGDGKSDLYAFSGADYAVPYLGMLRSTGDGFTLTKRFDKNLPGWQMGRHDRILIGDFNGNGCCDIAVFNGEDWASRHLAVFSSTKTGLKLVKKYKSILPGWTMGTHDRFLVGDFDGDGKDDLFVFNGEDWRYAGLAMLRSTGTGFSGAKVYTGALPGWTLRRNDRFLVGDVNGDGKADLFASNVDDWQDEYLGTLTSDGTGLSAQAACGSVGEWMLTNTDLLEVCNYEGSAGKRDLIVHNKDWIGMVRATPGLELQSIYYRWIHNYHHGRNW